MEFNFNGETDLNKIQEQLVERYLKDAESKGYEYPPEFDVIENVISKGIPPEVLIENGLLSQGSYNNYMMFLDFFRVSSIKDLPSILDKESEQGNVPGTEWEKFFYNFDKVEDNGDDYVEEEYIDVDEEFETDSSKYFTKTEDGFEVDVDDIVKVTMKNNNISLELDFDGIYEKASENVSNVGQKTSNMTSKIRDDFKEYTEKQKEFAKKHREEKERKERERKEKEERARKKKQQKEEQERKIKEQLYKFVNKDDVDTMFKTINNIEDKGKIFNGNPQAQIFKELFRK